MCGRPYVWWRNCSSWQLGTLKLLQHVLTYDLTAYKRLPPREIDILGGIAKGFSYAEIASHLGLSKQTVPGHIKNIYRKLEVHTRSEAVFEAVQQGLIKL